MPAGGDRVADGVGDVVLTAGDVLVSGRVDGDIVTFSGRTRLLPPASVDGDLIYTDDRPRVAPAATVGGDIEDLDWADLDLFPFVGAIVFWLAITFSMAVLGILLLLIAPRAADAAHRQAESRFWTAVGIGVAGVNEVRDNLARENIVGTPDSSIPGQKVDTGDEATAFAAVMRKHALEATGGRTYAEMGRFLDARGNETSDEEQAAKDPKTGQPIPNRARDIWVTETALATALNVAFFAERVAFFSIAMGVALLLTGIGAVGGIALAWIGIRELLAIAPANLPRVDSIRIDLVVLAFTAAIALAAAHGDDQDGQAHRHRHQHQASADCPHGFSAPPRRDRPYSVGSPLAIHSANPPRKKYTFLYPPLAAATEAL